MTIERKIGWPILSLVSLRPIVSPPIEVRRETEVTVEGLNQVWGMAEPRPLVSTVPKSKNRINNARNKKNSA